MLATDIRFSLDDGTVINLSEDQADLLYAELWSLVGKEPGALPAAARVAQVRRLGNSWRRNSFDDRESCAVSRALAHVDCS